MDLRIENTGMSNYLKVCREIIHDVAANEERYY